MGRQLVVFDFDWSFVEQDTDRYVFEVLKPEYRKEIRERKSQVQWTDLCAQYLAKLHQDGFTSEQIAEALRTLPFHPAVKRATETYKQIQGATFLCLSNSNTFYIDTILKHHLLTSLFEDIITNPAHAEPSGLLKLERRVKPDAQQHECKIGCSPNMCKGEELENWLNKQGGLSAFDRIIYVGDGSNDFCPLLRLRGQDVAFVRKWRGLEKRIELEAVSRALKCQVHKWGGPYELEQLFLTSS